MGIINRIRKIGTGLKDIGLVTAGGILKGAGSVTLGVLDVAGLGMMKAGKYAFNGLEKGVIKAGKGVGEAGKQIVTGVKSEDPFRNPLGYAADRFYAVSKKAGYWDYGKSEYDAVTNTVKHRSPGIRFTKTGLGVMAGIAAVSGTVGAHDNYMDNRVGPIDPVVRTATPDLGDRQYRRQLTAEDTGATGDLVFALHNLRH